MLFCLSRPSPPLSCLTPPEEPAWTQPNVTVSMFTHLNYSLCAHSVMQPQQHQSLEHAVHLHASCISCFAALGQSRQSLRCARTKWMCFGTHVKFPSWATRQRRILRTRREQIFFLALIEIRCAPITLSAQQSTKFPLQTLLAHAKLNRYCCIYRGCRRVTHLQVTLLFLDKDECLTKLAPAWPHITRVQ